LWVGFSVWAILRERLWIAIATSLYTVMVVVGAFASTYLVYGSKEDWSIRLTRVDALLVAVGTLATTGTNGIEPVSETSRGLLTLQMSIDIVLGVVLFALLAARIFGAAAPRGTASRDEGRRAPTLEG
jgi:hypothetical protein